MTSALTISVKMPLPEFTIDVNLKAPSGRLALFGASGAGKTSILKSIAGLIKPASGSVQIGAHTIADTRAGHWPAPSERHLGFVFQENRLFPHLTVLQNIAYGADSDSPAFEAAIAIAGAENLLPRTIHSLSGGEQRRVAMARALAMDPRLLLLDEPYNGLDRRSAMLVRQNLAAHLAGNDIPFILVTHNLDDVLAHDCHVGLIDRGTVSLQGSADDVFNNAAGAQALSADDAATRSGPLSIFRVMETVEDHKSQLLRCRLSNGAPLLLPHLGEVPASTFAKIAASDVSIVKAPPVESSILNVLPGTILAIHPSGDIAVLDLDIGGALVLRAQITSYSVSNLGLEPGQTVYAQIKSAALIS